MRALAVVVALLVAAPAPAAVPPAVRELMTHMSKGMRATQVGDWVTYRFDGTGSRIFYWRMAVVGEEKDALGRDAVWVEMESGTHVAMRAPLSQMRMLVAREGDSIRFDAITRLYVGGPFDRPQEYSKEALEHVLKQQEEDTQKRQQARAANAASATATLPEKPVVRSGKEARLMTFAGSVTAVPVEVVYRTTVVKRMWMSREIPLLHLARIDIPGIRHSLEVAGFGVDAKPRMVLPAPSAPKVRLEYADKVFPDMSALEQQAEAHPEVSP